MKVTLRVERRQSVEVTVEFDEEESRRAVLSRAADIAANLPENDWEEDGCGYQVFDINGEEVRG